MYVINAINQLIYREIKEKIDKIDLNLFCGIRLKICQLHYLVGYVPKSGGAHLTRFWAKLTKATPKTEWKNVKSSFVVSPLNLVLFISF